MIALASSVRAPAVIGASQARSSAARRTGISRVIAVPSRAFTPFKSPVVPERKVVVKATDETEARDFDGILNNLADKFDASENKPAVIAYSAAGVLAFLFAEWLIHRPALDILLGFPVQLVGLLVLPWLSVRYIVDGEDLVSDVSDVAGDLVRRLPGLDGK